MTELPSQLFTAEQTRQLDQLIIQQEPISAASLMARAAAAALNILQSSWPHAKTILVVCGAGNNAGDGYQLARQALALDYQVHVVELSQPHQLSKDSLSARQALLDVANICDSFEGELPDTEVIVDAILGTGLNREVTGRYAEAIQLINQQSTAHKLALDIPSGLSADTGHIYGMAVKAEVTVSFLGLNQGLFTHEGPQHTGQCFFNALNIDNITSYWDSVQPSAQLIDYQTFKPLLKPRAQNSHKGSFGHLLIIGGNQGMSGAVRMAAEAGARTGAGLTSIATRTSHANLLSLSRPELMSRGVESNDELKSLLTKASVIVLGPGLGLSEWSQQMFHQSIISEKYKVVDADALTLLSKTISRSDHWILTPHPGEAARLLGCSSQEVQQDRFAAIKAIQQRYGGVIVLKGSGTLIYDGIEPVKICRYGNPGMASGGMGDTLAGIIGGLLAQKLSLFNSASLGVMIHSLAADKEAESAGERGMLAMDLLPHLRKLLNPNEFNDTSKAN